MSSLWDFSIDMPELWRMLSCRNNAGSIARQLIQNEGSDDRYLDILRKYKDNLNVFQITEIDLMIDILRFWINSLHF